MKKSQMLVCAQLGGGRLGWFQDPVLSNMLKRLKADLASLIIHEFGHGTIFVKDSVRFNENLANFIGDEGAELFLRQKYGQDAIELKAYQAQRADEHTFKSCMLAAARSLDKLYKGFGNVSDSIKSQLKATQIESIKSGFDTLTFQSDRYSGYFENFTPNNTFFVMLRYNAQQENNCWPN